MRTRDLQNVQKLRFLFPKLGRWGTYDDAYRAYAKLEEFVRFGMTNEGEALNRGVIKSVAYFMEYSEEFLLMAEVNFYALETYRWLCDVMREFRDKTRPWPDEKPWCTVARKLRACVELLDYTKRVVAMHDGSEAVYRRFHDADREEELTKYLDDPKLFLADAKSRLAECSIRRAAELGD